MKQVAYALALCLLSAATSLCQSNAPSGELSPRLKKFVFEDSVPLKIVRDVVPSKPFTVIGPRGAFLGQQDGSFEAWIFPWKLFSNFRITAEMQNYDVPIDVNEYASSIEVRPDHTTITFAHANFTIREVLFAPHNAPEGAGVLAFFEMEAVRPMMLTIQFSPEMKQMWPAASDDHSFPEWIKTADGGFYVMRTSLMDHAAAIGMPGAKHGLLAPYQERAKTYPTQFVVHFDPQRDRDKLFPLLMATTETPAESKVAVLETRLSALEQSIQSLYEDTGAYYKKFVADHMTIDTPDKQFDEAFLWSEVAIDQLKVQTTPGHEETALVAGFDGSGDSARPGFGWFFGRDALWTLYAVNAYGDFKLTRNQLEFLLKRQTPEGQIIHEWSQTAGIVDWKRLPYMLASADATPLLIMAANDYLQISGDLNFLKAHWDGLQRAWRFETSHDSDGDGIYENIAGSGWVESWPPGLPHQEIYLAALDQQSSTAFAKIARALGNPQLADEAEKRAHHVAQQLEKEYFISDANFYAFSRNADGTLDSSATIFPAVADWDGTFNLAKPGAMLSRWASNEFSTDWGTRDLSPSVSFFDPISYHQGTVWPLYTGWVSLSEYRNGRTLSGYSHLMQNADLTWAQNLGSVTELLSGEFYRWLGRSTSHQLWSSAMVFTPAVRGMFGLEWNAAENTLTVTPNLPAQWNEAKILGIPIGDRRVGLEMRRTGATLSITLTGDAAKAVKLRSRVLGATNGTSQGRLQIPLPAVEVGIQHGLPVAGAATSQLKVLEQQKFARSLRLRLSAPSGSTDTLFLRVNDAKIRPRIEGAEPSADGTRVRIQFPQGVGYAEKTVTVSW